MSLGDAGAGPDELTEEEVCAHLMRCELALLDAAVRCEQGRVETLLAEDFLEFGSSGRVWDRKSMVKSLAGEAYIAPIAEEMKCACLGPDVALIIYRTARMDEVGARTVTLRSSLWIRELGRWRVRFHQGTKVP